MLAELEEDFKRRLAEAILTELKLTEDVLEANQSIQDTIPEPTAHTQSIKSARLTKWVANASTEVATQPQVQDSTVERETRKILERLPPNPSFVTTGVPTSLRKNCMQSLPINAIQGL